MGWPAPLTPAGVALWNSCTIGDLKLPPDAAFGAAIVFCESSQKLDQAAASGKDKAKTTQKGREPCPVDIEYRFHARIWAAVETQLATIDPNGTARGGPFKFSHPDADRRGVKWIMVEKVGKVEWKGHYGTVQIKAVEWEEPKKVVGGSVRGTAATNAALPIQLELLIGELNTLNTEIAAIDAQLLAIDRATDNGTVPNQSQIARLQQQRNDLAAKRQQVQSGIAATQNNGLNNTSTTPDRAKAGASQNTAAGQKPTKMPKADPYTASSGPNANP